jgi:alpha-1,2-mannosyltransferase
MSTTAPTAWPVRWTRAALGLALVFAALNAVNAINKGGDAAVFFEGGRRLLGVESLYAGSSAAQGYIGPPFQAVFFAPFAALATISPLAARLLWHIAGIACLVAAVVLTTRSWSAARGELGLWSATSAAAVLVPLAAVLLPIQTNFEHQNMNPLLLALITAATWLLVRGSDGRAGVLLGVAIALKVFPALLLIVLVLRQRWRAASAGVLTALVLTLVPLPFYGTDAFGQLIRDFWRLANSGFPARGNNQSLLAALDRLFGPGDGDFIHQAEGTILIVYAALAGVLLFALALAAARARAPAVATTTLQMWAALVAAVLLSPIAWDHYWVLLFPAIFVLYDSRDARLLGVKSQYLFWIAAVLITGFSRVLVGRELFSLARAASCYTIAAVMAFAVLVWLCVKIAREEPSAAVRESG